MLRSLNFWLLLLLLVCGISLWSASGGLERLRGGSQSLEERVLEPTSPVRLKVLNGTGVSGLARDISLLVAAEGCVVEGVGNAEGQWTETVLVNRRLEEPRARGLASRLGGVALVQQWDGRCHEDAVLILGADHPRLREALKAGAGSKN